MTYKLDSTVITRKRTHDTFAEDDGELGVEEAEEPGRGIEEGLNGMLLEVGKDRGTVVVHQSGKLVELDLGIRITKQENHEGECKVMEADTCNAIMSGMYWFRRCMEYIKRRSTKKASCSFSLLVRDGGSMIDHWEKVMLKVTVGV